MATTNRSMYDIAGCDILIDPPSILHAAQPQQAFLFYDDGRQIGLRIALPTHLIRRLKSCRVKLDSGNTPAIAIELDLLIENNCKILLSRYFSGF